MLSKRDLQIRAKWRGEERARIKNKKKKDKEDMQWIKDLRKGDIKKRMPFSLIIKIDKKIIEGLSVSEALIAIEQEFS